MSGRFVVFDLLIPRTDDRTGIVHARDVAFLTDLQRMAKSGIGFFELERVAIGPGSPALQGWTRVTREIVSSPLYRVAADIATRAGIVEGLILAPEHERERGQIPADRSRMSVTQAANTLGISRAAVHKAIQQKRLAAERYGNVILLSRAAVLRYKRGRSEGGRKPPNSRLTTAEVKRRAQAAAISDVPGLGWSETRKRVKDRLSHTRT